LQRADFVILYHPDLKDAALMLAEHRRDHDNLIVETIPSYAVFNEFGGGSPDPSAIRDFARMMHNRDASFKYMLLIGDATYDFLNHSPEVPYQNFMPAFETEESLDPIRSFPSDDYYALLDKEEGANLVGALDIAVGRLPVSTSAEAMDIVNKIIYYDTNPVTLNDWRNRMVMTADDEDGNVHLGQADGLAVETALEHPVLNEVKIYLDAYPQQATPGGDRYPGVNEDIDLNINKGMLTMTYLGHGGPNGWSQERVLGINQVQSYDNLDNMPLFITATCSFAAYDEPGFTSAGEHLLTNPNGGAIGLMTTVRAVFSGSNERLTDEVLEIIYNQDENGFPDCIGEVLRKSKNANSIDTVDTNARKFTLLGDPSMKLALPRFKVAVSELQGKPIDPNFPDTLKALETAVVSGIITDRHDQLLSGFNGTLYLTVFDKPQIRKTLANDGGSSVRTFTTQTRQLFKGTATIESGKWTIEFVLPKDIDFSFGNGKMSFYAEDGQIDAAGNYNGFIVGGVADGGLTDDTPPVIDLFMNDNHFVSGGITDSDPDIYAELSDDHGINVSGTSVGHDIEAILDGDDVHSFILNDFYQAELNDHSRGTVRFPLKGLAPGLHTITMTAWDLANNPAQAYIEFYVSGANGPEITNVRNQPNPFSDETNITFEHNRAGSLMDIQVDIFSPDGRQVNSIRKTGYEAGGYRVEDLTWSGDDQYGAPVPSGLYVYRLKVTFTTNGVVETTEKQAGKLVVLH
ncbi:MAG TPA: type IX secretion system sortase PorU, partial [Saprospiraceae bacterium]|nr:type IX secretion system sortase PorU [Saprospiraceae bacterium]